jgi:hypothetical protein
MITPQSNFNLACKFGNLEEAKQLYALHKNNINIHIDDEYAFRWSCINGHLKVAKWLIKLGVQPPQDHSLCSYHSLYPYYTQLQQARQQYHTFLHNQTYSDNYASDIIRNIVKRYL